MIAEVASARAAVLLVAVSVKPDPTKAPGINALKDLVNGLAAYAAVAAVASILLGGIAWALGDRMGLDRASSVGKSGVLAGCGLAFLVGIAAVLVNFFLATGSSASAGTPQTDGTGSQRPPAVVQVVDSATVVHGEPSAYS
ncbi:DUF6112 family protein [Pseudofrankia asymbiotica]|uniref:Uncharacterized protein n=1 Tax=Pseudofrankia asymbiotica TaxID=1834516 RepID=A0A1V2I881_9ACTN|nr:DUF6112 family protein [Pseudofrankia asymbiotica]ONH26818.1 hypothetical protein BL253_23770 [Pseudofrankia asymbiotica]